MSGSHFNWTRKFKYKETFSKSEIGNQIAYFESLLILDNTNLLWTGFFFEVIYCLERIS